MTHRTPYDDIAYSGAVVAAAWPDHIALCSAFHDGPSPQSRSFCMVELGCGDGANLLPLAYYSPESTFIGIDSSSTHLAAAREAAESLCLSNIRFVLTDVRHLRPGEFPRADYVIAHGLYSWVPDQARDAILNFCRQALAAAGLAYISYNAQPGWATRRLVREALVRARSVRDAPIEEKAGRAIKFAAQLLEHLPSRDYASAILLRDELERVRNSKPGYVYHEYLATVNDGFWLGEFVERARGHRLRYVCDAQFGRWEGHVPEQLKTELARADLDCIEQEEAADLVCHRYFRASVLCRADAPRVSVSRLKLVEQAHLATPLTAKSDPFDLTDGVFERFRGAGGAEITIGASITKAAVLLMAAQWPAGLLFERLCGKAAEFLAGHGIDTPGGGRSQLIDDLIPLFEAGQVDLRLREPFYRHRTPDCPCVHALARFEAAHRNVLTTPYHVPLSFDAQTVELVRAMDGSRSLLQLQHVFGDALVSQTVDLLARWGLLD
jgi:SAM-dependent methyltransferase